MRRYIHAGHTAEFLAECIDNKNIFNDDPTAIEQLERKIEGLTIFQDKMKQANKIYKSKKTDEEKKIELKKIDIIDESFSPFPTWQLSNNNAKIKNAKQRLEQLEKQENDITTGKIINGVNIIDNVEDNRLQMFFDGKPKPEIIKQLKSNGFRWTPTLGCWQRYRSDQAMLKAEEIAKLLQ